MEDRGGTRLDTSGRDISTGINLPASRSWIFYLTAIVWRKPHPCRTSYELQTNTGQNEYYIYNQISEYGVRPVISIVVYLPVYSEHAMNSLKTQQSSRMLSSLIAVLLRSPNSSRFWCSSGSVIFAIMWWYLLRHSSYSPRTMCKHGAWRRKSAKTDDQFGTHPNYYGILINQCVPNSTRVNFGEEAINSNVVWLIHMCTHTYTLSVRPKFGKWSRSPMINPTQETSKNSVWDNIMINLTPNADWTLANKKWHTCLPDIDYPRTVDGSFRPCPHTIYWSVPVDRDSCSVSYSFVCTPVRSTGRGIASANCPCAIETRGRKTHLIRTATAGIAVIPLGRSRGPSLCWPLLDEIFLLN